MKSVIKKAKKMEDILAQFRSFFYTGIFSLIIGTVMYLVFKKNIIKAEDDKGKTNQLNFTKKIILISSIIVIGYLILSLFYDTKPIHKIHKSSSEFIKTRVLNFNNNHLQDSNRRIYFDKSLQYFENRYGEKILYNNFKFDKYDTIEMTLNIYFLENPEIGDSARIELRNKISTTQDLKTYLK